MHPCARTISQCPPKKVIGASSRRLGPNPTFREKAHTSTARPRGQTTRRRGHGVPRSVGARPGADRCRCPRAKTRLPFQRDARFGGRSRQVECPLREAHRNPGNARLPPWWQTRAKNLEPEHFPRANFGSPETGTQARLRGRLRWKTAAPIVRPETEPHFLRHATPLPVPMTGQTTSTE